ncbi:hypothetical protein V1525DRAFT_453536 [Lipomyces kononenkoae]|uniref:Uncharacterized protein n=1 Tax=Lipomyces kononenkoae TaxID=34357 RepID=A0ACC3TCI3_LIPKO
MTRRFPLALNVLARRSVLISRSRKWLTVCVQNARLQRDYATVGRSAFNSEYSDQSDHRRLSQVETCPSCGAPFTLERENQGGAGSLPERFNVFLEGNTKIMSDEVACNTQQVVKDADRKFKEIASKLSLEDRELLGLNSEAVPAKPTSDVQTDSPEVYGSSAFGRELFITGGDLLNSPTGVKQRGIEYDGDRNTKPLICQRCHSLYHHNMPFLLPPFKRKRIFEMLPADKKVNIVHVIDAYDFPMSVLPLQRLLHMYNRSAKRIICVITRADLLVNKEGLVLQRLRPYFLDLLHQINQVHRFSLVNASKLSDNPDTSLWNMGLGIDEPNTVLAQSSVEENARLLGQRLQPRDKIQRADLHLVSSRVGWSIRKLFESLPDESYFIGYSNVGKSRLVQALLDLNGQTIRDSKVSKSKFSQEKAGNESGPGASYLPGMTRSMMSYDVRAFGALKKMHDLPGIEDCNGKMWSIVKPEAIKPLVKGRFYEPKNREHMVVHHGQCLNVAGLILIEAPEIQIIAWTSIGQPGLVKMYVNRDLERSMEVLKSTDPSLKLSVRPDIPHEYELAGSFRIDGLGADIVVRGLGFVELRVSGRIPEGGALVRVHTPKGVNVTARKPIYEAIRNRATVRSSDRSSHITRKNVRQQVVDK